MGSIVITNFEGKSLNIDCTVKDSRSYTSKVTNKHVGSGASVSDTKILENTKYSLEGIITNTPNIKAEESDITIDGMGDMQNIFKYASKYINISEYVGQSHIKITVEKVSESNRVLVAHKYLLDLFNNKKTFVMEIKGFEKIENLQLTEYKSDFSSENGDCLKFNLEIQEIKIVGTKTAKVPKEKAAAKVEKKKHQGTVQPKPVEEEKKPESKDSAFAKWAFK